MANLVEYVKTVWENGKTALNAARMNNMEQGISNCASQINKLGDSVSPLKTFAIGDKSSVTLSFKSANHSAAFLLIDNNGAPSVIFLNCMDSTSRILAGQNLNITFTSKTTAVIKTPTWSIGLVMAPSADCSISVA